jgi:hypothetical protein
LVAGILVFANSGVGAWRARRMLWIYVFAKLVLSLFYAALTVANDFDVVGGHIPAAVWVEDGLFWLVLTSIYPTLLIPVLRLKVVELYYKKLLQV